MFGSRPGEAVDTILGDNRGGLYSSYAWYQIHTHLSAHILIGWRRTSRIRGRESAEGADDAEGDTRER